ncbi:DEAD/DEAH box helicase family protein, partial [Francisella tularensis]|uniref:DEAD/DEAH box helicase family protein n=1 Tax=Francisella tularensis TaxID=263 RepID=UPI002381B089
TLVVDTGCNKTSAEYLFATVHTLKNSIVLANFKIQEFEYIIIDEVHHAEAESYKNVLEHYKQKFLLGMTATPERSDAD